MKYTFYRHEIRIFGVTLFRWGKYEKTIQELQQEAKNQLDKEINKALFGYSLENKNDQR
jgi:hypothetical protein